MEVGAIDEWKKLKQKHIKMGNESTSKKTIKKSKSTMRHEGFIRCIDYLRTSSDSQFTNRLAWIDYFTRYCDGIFPKKFTIVGDNLVSRVTRSAQKITLQMDPPILVPQLMEFCKKNDRSLPIVDKKSGTSYENIDTMEWSKIKKVSIRDSLIFTYIKEKCVELDITDNAIHEKYHQIVLDMIAIKGLNLKNVEFVDGKIIDIPSITVTTDGITAYDCKHTSVIQYGFCEDINKPIVLYVQSDVANDDQVE